MTSYIARRVETEQQRCHRQRRQAIALVRAGKMAREDFDWLEKRYWSKHDPITNVNQPTAQGAVN